MSERTTPSLAQQLEAVQRYNELLKRAIRNHRDQKADDKCWQDDLNLYAVLGDNVEPDNHVGDKHMMMANCFRYVMNRCESGGPWRNYIDLEKELEEAHYLLDHEGVAPRGYYSDPLRGGIIVPLTRTLAERIKLLIQTIKGLAGE